MLRWILADAHGGADPQADEALGILLDRAIEQRVDLWILGDLFAVWLAPDRFCTPFQQGIIARLRTLRAGGSRLTFVVGNRDYLVAKGQLGRTFDEVIEGEALRTIGGAKTLVTHGDRANPNDALYERWYRMSRGRRADTILQSMPTGFASWLARALERRFQGTNQRYKSGQLPIAALEALGRRAAAAGAERVLVGHFHADSTIEVPGGAPVTIAPAWLEHRKILVDDGSLTSVDPLA